MLAFSKRAATSLLEFAERGRRAIHSALTGLASTGGFGPHAILVFETEDEYYEYIAPYYPEGHYAVSAGVYLNEGYGHFVLPRREPGLLEPVVAHELTHALLSHLPLPRWLDEGVTMISPEQIYIDDTVKLEPDVVLYPGVFLEGETLIKRGAVIGPYAVLRDCVVELGARVAPFTEATGERLTLQQE
jgi:hypothetical protein